MIKIYLTNDQQQEPKAFRKQASSKDSEKALMVLLSSDGKAVPEIALMLKQNHHTIRDWLKRYKTKGIKGLNRNFSPGRPSDLREKTQQHIKNIIGDSPVEFFWKWLKPKVYGFSAFGGISELISRFRKLVRHYNRGELNIPIKFNLRVYEKIL